MGEGTSLHEMPGGHAAACSLRAHLVLEDQARQCTNQNDIYAVGSETQKTHFIQLSKHHDSCILLE